VDAEAGVDPAHRLPVALQVGGEPAGVQAGGQQLGRVDDPGAAAVEVGVAVGHVHPPGGHGRPGLPWQHLGEQLELGQGPLDRVAARLDHHHLGLKGPEGGQVQGWRLLPRRRPQRVAAGDGDQLRHPGAPEHHRVEPLDADHRRPAAPGGLALEAAQPLQQPADQGLAGGPAVEGGRDPAEVVPDVAQPPRVQAHHLDVAAGQPLGGRAHGAVGDRADLAQVLGDDHVRGQRGQSVDVQVVDGQGGPEQLAHRPVDVAAGASVREPGGGEGREPGHLRRVVALMRHPDQLAGGPQGADDLGRRRQQRDDPHR